MRDKLRTLSQTSTVSKYLSEFGKISLTIPDMSEGEMFHKFVAGLELEVRVELLKSGAQKFEEASTSHLESTVLFGVP